MITIDVTMLIHIINILVLIAVLNTVLYRPVKGILRKRKEDIAAMESDIETFEKNSTLRMEELEQKLNAARGKAKDQLDGVKREIQEESNEKLAVVRKESDAKKEDAMSKIHAEFASAETTLKGELDGFARGMAEKILGRALA